MLFKNPEENYVDRAEFVVNGMLIRKDFIVMCVHFLSIMRRMIRELNYICVNSIMRTDQLFIKNT